MLATSIMKAEDKATDSTQNRIKGEQKGDSNGYDDSHNSRNAWIINPEQVKNNHSVRPISGVAF